MPLTVFHYLPLPSLQTYLAFSAALLSSAVFYSYHRCKSLLLDSAIALTTRNHTSSASQNSPYSLEALISTTDTIDFDSADGVLSEAVSAEASVESANYIRNLSYGSIVEMCSFLKDDPFVVFIACNTAYCVVFVILKLIQHQVFGGLRSAEKQHIKDCFWNFVFYKFIFTFGVLNVSDFHEMLFWISWFTFLGCIRLSLLLVTDRFEYLSFTPSYRMAVHVKMFGFALLTGVASVGLFVFAIWTYVTERADGGVFGFMLADSLLMMVRNGFVLTRYALHLYDLKQETTWERRDLVSYYITLLADVAIVVLDLVHHFHMLIRGNVFLSVASLVICLQIKHLTNELRKRLHRHRNWAMVVHSIDTRLANASPQDIATYDSGCSICWEPLVSAKKLPCGHLYHATCLRSWLEYDMTCPVCRQNLQKHLSGQQAQRNMAPQAGSNHSFYLNLSHYISWIPSLSVEVRTHPSLDDADIDQMARQAHAMFPQISIATFATDLQQTWSLEMTIDNAAEGRLDPQFSSDAETDSGSDDDVPAIEPPSQQPSTSQAFPSGSSSPVTHSLPPGVNLHHYVFDGDSFSRNPDERQVLLQQRKQMFLSMARVRYQETNDSTPSTSSHSGAYS